MPNLKEEILKEWDDKLNELWTEPDFNFESYDNLVDYTKKIVVELRKLLSSKIDEIEKEVMARLKKEKETWPHEQSMGWGWIAVESCENAISEVFSTPPSKLSEKK